MDLIQDGAVSIYPKIYVLKYLDNTSSLYWVFEG